MEIDHNLQSPNRPPDLVYTITDDELSRDTPHYLYCKGDEAMDIILKRTEREAETRRERFEYVEVCPRFDIMAYTVRLWVVHI